MKDEIKKILDRLKDSVTNPIIDVPVMGGVSEPIDNSQCLEPNECKILLDYITNLQESEAYYYGYYKDYKSKIDKARGMIRFIAYNSERPLTITELNKVYNILGGDDND